MFVLRWPSLGLYGRVNGDFQGGLCQRGPSQTAAASPPVPVVSPLLTPASTGDPPHCQVVLVQFGLTAPLLWALMHTRVCVCSLRLESLFLQSCGSLYNQIPLAFKFRFPGVSQSLCWIPRLGSLTWGSEISQQWENFFGITFLQPVGHLPGRYEVWFYRECAPPSRLTAASSLSLGVGCLFWWVPVSSCWWLFNS